jgi:AcrR family transcriptional regulator
MAGSLYRREGRFERIKSQVISARETAEVALELIRNEGVEAVTIRRLAFELDVKSASLYYHFRNKEEILALAARLALEGIRGAGDPARPWREWLLENTVRYRKALLVYPDLIPTLMRRHPLHIGTEEHERAVQLLESQGVPVEIIMPLFDALESLACGSALYSTASSIHDRAQEWADGFPALHRMSTSVRLSEDEAFERAARGLIDGLAGPA